jgi:phage protein D/phage baseplate assembly protein gpV
MPITQPISKIYVPTFEMRVDNRPLEMDIAKTILEISVTETLNSPSQFSFRLNDPTLKLIEREDGRFTEGKRVEISIGFVDNTRKMIVGEISALAPDFPSSGPATLEVQGFDLLHRLTRGTTYQKSGELTNNSGIADSDIVSKIAKEMKLNPSVDSTSKRSQPRVQNHQTNFAFLQELAQANGYFFWVDGDTLYFKKQSRPANTIQLEWHQTLMSFSPRLSTAGQVNAVEVRGWDPMQKQSFSARVQRSRTATAQLSRTGQQQIAQGSGGQSVLFITDAHVTSEQEARDLAERILADRQQTVISGSGTSVGQPDLRAGTILELSGMSGRFNGNYLVTSATHTVSDGGYQTSFQVNGAQVGSAPDLSDLLADSSDRDRSHDRTYGVVVGTVMKNKDPQKLGKVQVKLPGLSDDEIGHWARVATLMAGADRGTFFLPEEHDEVLVAFEQGDISRPYILGALWNGKDKPPDTNADGKNNLRLIKSRSGHLVRFDDTDGSEKIEIIDKSGSNRIAIDTANKAIAIESAKNISIKAPQGTIELSAQKIEISSTAETKIQAKGGLNLDGNPGNTKIEGATINLN